MENSNNMILNIEDIKNGVSIVANRYGIQKVILFGSYFDGQPTEKSDVDLLVSYGDKCRGLQCICFMEDLEKTLGKSVDVLNIDFPPRFLRQGDLMDERRVIYSGQR